MEPRRRRRWIPQIGPGLDHTSRNLEGSMSVNARKVVLAAGLLMLAMVACKSNKPAMTGYATPDDAANALIAAAKAGDQNALLAIFGPESTDLCTRVIRCKTRMPPRSLSPGTT